MTRRRLAASTGTRDQRGVLALATLGSVFVYAFVLLFTAGAAAQMPPWMVAVASMVVGHYFGAREQRDRVSAYESVIADLRARNEPETVGNGGG